ncbi:MAG: cytochrome C [Syntrophales bacterium]
MYPLWIVPGLTSGMVVAIIATFHMLPSHLSISAMWFNVYLETKAYRENRPELLEFVKKYALFVLIFSYVFGSLSGIGIWYAATVASPRGISGLIHNYVWGWATEWVFFIVEVAGIFIYYYTLGKVDRRTHLKIGWIFAIAAWATMVVITGILAFMVSPGAWPKTGGFFDGFFNQTYWSQLLMRTALMFAIAGAYALVVATRLKDAATRSFVVRTASLWGAAGTVLGAALFFWYLATLPMAARDLAGSLVPVDLKIGAIVSAALLVLYFLVAALKPSSVRLAPALVAILVLFGGIWSAERAREMIRKPYIIPQYMYANQFIANAIAPKGVKAETALINERGILAFAPFVPRELRRVTTANAKEAGRMIGLIECSACHAFGKSGLRPMAQIVKRLDLKDADGAEGILDALGGYPSMPPFLGTAAEKRALAVYLASLYE